MPDDNWGKCGAIECRTYSPRCGYGYCKPCCDKRHFSISESQYHSLPWEKTPPARGFKIVDHRHGISTPPIEAKPEPQELIEHTEDDWPIETKPTTNNWTATHGWA